MSNYEELLNIVKTEKDLEEKIFDFEQTITDKLPTDDQELNEVFEESTQNNLDNLDIFDDFGDFDE